MNALEAELAGSPYSNGLFMISCSNGTNITLIWCNNWQSYSVEPEVGDILEANNGAGLLGYLNLKNRFQAFADEIAVHTEVTNVLTIGDKWNVEASSETYKHNILVVTNPLKLLERKLCFQLDQLNKQWN